MSFVAYTIGQKTTFFLSFHLLFNMTGQTYLEIMQQPKIIHKILEYLPTQSLIVLRSTCKVWNEEACKILQGWKIVDLCNSTDLSKYLAIFSRKDPFLKELPFPFSQFHIHKMRLNLIQDNYLLRNFFRINSLNTISHIQLDLTGPHFRLKCLRLCVLELMVNVTSVTITLKDFYEVWPASLTDQPCAQPLKSVKKLTLYGFGRECSLRAVLAKLLPYFPHIYRLEAGEQIGRLVFDLIYGDFDDPDSNDGFSPVPFPHLSHLDLHYIYPTQIDNIINKQLPLEGLKAKLHMVSDSQLQALLEYLAPTLENFSLECHSNGQEFPPPTINMTALVDLELSRFHLPLSTLKHFPMLKKLAVKMVELSSANITLPNDNLLSLTLDSCKLDSHILADFGRLFPSLRKLHVGSLFAEEGSCPHLLQEMLTEMKSLEEVHLFMGGSGTNKKGGEERETFLEQIFLGGHMRPLTLSEEKQEKKSIRIFNRETKELLGHFCRDN